MQKNTANAAKNWNKQLEVQRKIREEKENSIKAIQKYEYIPAGIIKEEKNNKNNKTIIYLCFAIILIIITSFLSAGIYKNFFYEKVKKDEILAIKEIEKFEIKEKEQKIVNRKKWKRTEWEEYKGKVCNQNNKCIYNYVKKWKDCNLQNNRCNTKEKSLRRNSHYLLKAKTTYYNN